MESPRITARLIRLNLEAKGLQHHTAIASNYLTHRTRIRCRECGHYFDRDDGIGLVGFCFACIKHCDYPDPVAMAAYLFPIEPAPDPREIEFERTLSRGRLAIYSLYDTLSKAAGHSLPPRDSVRRALEIFDKTFPEFAVSPPERGVD